MLARAANLRLKANGLKMLVYLQRVCVLRVTPL